MLSGERRYFTASKDGKTIKCEAVYLGDDKGSIVWVAIAPEGEAVTLVAGVIALQPASASVAMRKERCRFMKCLSF